MRGGAAASAELSTTAASMGTQLHSFLQGSCLAIPCTRFWVRIHVATGQARAPACALPPAPHCPHNVLVCNWKPQDTGTLYQGLVCVSYGISNHVPQQGGPRLRTAHPTGQGWQTPALHTPSCTSEPGLSARRGWGPMLG
jgi:hypothetical protein